MYFEIFQKLKIIVFMTIFIFVVITESSIADWQYSDDYDSNTFEPRETSFVETTTERKLILVEKLEANSAAHTKLKKLLPKAPECGGHIRNRIYGGTETPLGEHPWTVLIDSIKIDETDFRLSCGGSLINEYYVLTAAGCASGLKNFEYIKAFRVRTGEWNRENEIDCSPDDEKDCAPLPVYYNVTEIIIHENYRIMKRTKQYDIALLRLDEKVIFNDFVKPICLPLDPKLWEKDYSGQRFTAVGWGSTERERTSQNKLQVELPFVPHNECQASYEKLNVSNISETQICAGGEEGKDTCMADGGSSLMIYNVDEVVPYWHTVGIVSYGVNCGKAGFPGVNTKVSSYLQWISEKIQE